MHGIKARQRAAVQRPPPGPATGRAFFAEIVHWTISDRSSPPSGGRFRTVSP